MTGFKRKLWHQPEKLSDNMLKTPANNTSEVLLNRYEDADFSARFRKLAGRDDDASQVKWSAQELQDL